MLTFCTLFDHNYLDKGLAMYGSLENVCKEFELFVLAMSDKCYEVLVDLNYPHIKPIKLVDFEDEELLRVKPERKVGEYCWTCSSSLIKYVLETYNPEYCTYLDSDMFFYSSPETCIEEMKAKNASALVVGHRFCRSDKARKEKKFGKYCVELNAFKNDTRGMDLLKLWRSQCLDHCSLDGDGKYWGDQKYLDNWCDDYDYVIETENMGVGVAPWNISQYRHSKCSGNKVCFQGKDIDLVFFHFESIQYIKRRLAKLNVFNQWGVDIKLVNGLYIPYLTLVDSIKTMLSEKYQINSSLRFHPGLPQEEGHSWSKSLRKRFSYEYWKSFFLYSLPKKFFSAHDYINITVSD